MEQEQEDAVKTLGAVSLLGTLGSTNITYACLRFMPWVHGAHIALDWGGLPGA